MSAARGLTHDRLKVLDTLAATDEPLSAWQIGQRAQPAAHLIGEWAHAKLRWLYREGYVNRMGKDKFGAWRWVVTPLGREALAKASREVKP